MVVRDGKRILFGLLESRVANKLKRRSNVRIPSCARIHLAIQELQPKGRNYRVHAPLVAHSLDAPVFPSVMSGLLVLILEPVRSPRVNEERERVRLYHGRATERNDAVANLLPLYLDLVQLKQPQDALARHEMEGIPAVCRSSPSRCPLSLIGSEHLIRLGRLEHVGLRLLPPRFFSQALDRQAVLPVAFHGAPILSRQHHLDRLELAPDSEREGVGIWTDFDGHNSA
mmetsp:Transcript_599/g.1462  ORF Transcript_599/g.1462 Transcript_599/m.1462 type:complete len:228 (-) Transcript_599:4837-5520(-)